MFKSPGNIDGNKQDGVEDGEERFLAKVFAHFGSDHLYPPNLNGLPQLVHQRVLDLFVQARQLDVHPSDPDQILKFPFLAEFLNDAVFQRNRPERFPDFRGRPLLIQLDLHDNTAGKVHAIIRSAPEKK